MNGAGSPEAPHAALVDRQFGAQAAAYVASAVHAQGPDLDEMAALFAAAPGRLLDLGCGGGHVALRMVGIGAPEGAAVVACDLSPAMLAAVAAQARERGLHQLSTQQGVAEHLPFPDAGFDWVMSRYSAHHWADLDAGLREAARVLRPGGRLVVADVIAPEPVPMDTFLQTIEFIRDPSHVRDYTGAEWRARLERAGLRVAGATTRRLRLEFGSWVARMRTPADSVAVIRALQAAASETVRQYFTVEADGSFTVDTLVIAARRD